MADKRVRPRNLNQTQTKALTSTRNNWADLDTLKIWANCIVISMMKFVVAFQSEIHGLPCRPVRIGPRWWWSDDEIRRDNSILDSENSSLSGRDKIGFIKNQFSLWGHNKACNELIIIYLDKTFQNVTYHLVSQSLCQFIESWCR